MPDAAETPETPDLAALVEAIAQLGWAQYGALGRLITTEGQSCDVATNLVKTLVNRELLTTVIDELTQGVRLCTAGCGHVWYDIPVPVREAYAQAVSDRHQNPAQRAPLPDAALEHPATVALATTAARLVAPPPPAQHWARIMNPLYGSLTLYGETYDQGQLLTLRGDWGDERLERLGFVEKAPPERAYLQAQCGVCGAWFLTEHFRDKHGGLRHRDRFASQQDLELGGGLAGPEGGTALRDITADAAERRQWVEFPPYLENSKASQQA